MKIIMMSVALLVVVIRLAPIFLLLLGTITASLSDTVVEKNLSDSTCSNSNQEQQSEEEQEEEEQYCNIYIAPSTLNSDNNNAAGIGMYAGVAFDAQQTIDFLPDFTIPLVDFTAHNSGRQNDHNTKFGWEDYYWNGFYLKCGADTSCGDVLLGGSNDDDDNNEDDVYFASCGFGSTANSYQDFVNIHIDYEVFPYYHNNNHHNDFDATNSDNDQQQQQQQHRHNHKHHHRSKDPGCGSYSQYQFRYSKTTQSIEPGEELFVNYGENWFHKRRSSLGPIPIRGDHQHAESLLRKFQVLKQKLLLLRLKNRVGSSIDDTNNTNSHHSLSDALDDAWNIFVINSHWKSRQFTALQEIRIERTSSDAAVLVGNTTTSTSTSTDGSSLSIVDALYNEMEQVGGLINFKKKKQMRKSLHWLKKNGICGDNLIVKKSTTNNARAGNGAFAKRFLKKGSIILPIPSILIPNRNIFDMYELQLFDDHDASNKYYDSGSGGGKRQKQDQQAKPKPKVIVNKDVIIGKQLMLNYCFGHIESTMLLSPYGPMINWVNHNQTLANVRLQWSSPERSNHNPKWLQKEIWYFENEQQDGGTEEVKVAMDLVALRDIHPGEEIFLDYGSEWEEAWQNHVREWEPIDGADQYESAEDLNRENARLKTKRQLELGPYPKNVVLFFNLAFVDPMGWKTALYAGQSLDEFINHGQYVPCEVIKYIKSYGGFGFYSVVIYDENNDDGQRKVIKEAPREAFRFHDVPYTADIFLPNAFRHEIGIPNDLFPKKWKNKPASTTA